MWGWRGWCGIGEEELWWVGSAEYGRMGREKELSFFCFSCDTVLKGFFSKGYKKGGEMGNKRKEFLMKT